MKLLFDTGKMPSVSQDDLSNVESVGRLQVARDQLLDTYHHYSTSWRTHHNRNSAVSELQKLDDRLLKDIGVERREIPSFVNRWFAKTH